GVVGEAWKGRWGVLVAVGVVGDVEAPAVELRLRRQLAEDQQVGDLEKARALAELLDRVAAVFEDSRLAVDEGDRRAAGGGVGECRVVGQHPEFGLVDFDLAEVHRPHGPVADRQLICPPRPVVGDRQRLGAGGNATLARWTADLLLGGHHPSYALDRTGREFSIAVRPLRTPRFRRARGY